MRSYLVGMVVVVAMTTSGAAHAQPADDPQPPANDKSVLTAYLVSVASTSLPLAVSALASDDGSDSGGTRSAVLGSIGIAALVLGPSGGQWYAGAGFTPGLGLRLGSALMIGALVVHDPHLEQESSTVLGLLTATVAYEAGLIWDLVTLPRQVHRHNREHALRLAPVVTDRGPIAGLALGGNF